MATGARVYLNGTGGFSTGTWHTMDFTSERYDYGGLHSNVNDPSRLVAPTKGVYVITTNFGWLSNGTGYRQLRLLLNGATTIAIIDQNAVSGQATRMELTTLYELAVNDYVEVQVWQNSGGNLWSENLTNANPEFAMHLVEAT